MKLAVLTMCIGDLYNRIAEVTHPSIRAYAEKCGADFLVWRDQGAHTVMGYRKFDIPELFAEYDRVLYVDTDILIRPDSPNIFELVPKERAAFFNEGAYLDRRGAKQKFRPDLPAFFTPETYYNAGVFLVSREHEMLFWKPPVEVDNFYEQTALNFNIFRFRADIFPLPYRFNRMLWMGPMTGEDRLDSHFLHYAGQFSNVSPEQEEYSLSVVREDAENMLKAPRPTERRIFIDTDGGLGDIIAMEPVVRYLVTKLYVNDRVTIRTSATEVFAHLAPKLEVIPAGQPYSTAMTHYVIRLMPRPDDLAPNVITHTLCHTTDFAAIMAFRGQLEREDCQIQLLPAAIDLPIDPLRAVVVHPGRGWPSKTFPVEWWNRVIHCLKAAGAQVVLIGQTSPDNYQGTVAVDSEETLDLRERLSIPEMFAVLQKAPVLLSNDSAPVHAAGAFDNYIGLVQSCKPAGLVLPYRHGRQYYKASAFGKVIPRRKESNQIEPVFLHQCSEQEMRDALPDPDTVATWALDRLSKARMQ